MAAYLTSVETPGKASEEEEEVSAEWLVVAQEGGRKEVCPELTQGADLRRP